MKPPRLRGKALTIVRALSETGSGVLGEIFKKNLGIHALKEVPIERRGELPLDARPRGAVPDRKLSDAELGPLSPSLWPNTASAYVRAYREGKKDPVEVIDRAIAELERLRRGKALDILVSDDFVRARREAAASRTRYAQGARLPLDGVPILVKDEFDVRGLTTTLGAIVGHDPPAAVDATPVDRLARAGAIMLGKTVLTEWGMSPLGQNAHVRMPHNAFSERHLPGGSSTGSGVGVALGLAPMALGGDGGGSIRIPACLNGVFGIKPTFGRVSRAGDGFKGSVAHAGPLGASSSDLAACLDVIASEADILDDLTAWAPPPPPRGFGARIGAGVKGLRIGVPDGEWEDASIAVARAGKAALAALEREGAVLVPLTMPIAKVAAPIGYLTIGCESLAAHAREWETARARIGDDVRLAFSILEGISAYELLDAQRLRAALRQELVEVLRKVDVIAMPTTATGAPKLDERDQGGTFSDPIALDAACRFAFLGNLTGLPAGTAPVGQDAEGLPVGLQIVGDAWQEHVVLGVLAHLERIEAAKVRRPPPAIDLLAM